MKRHPETDPKAVLCHEKFHGRVAVLTEKFCSFLNIFNFVYIMLIGFVSVLSFLFFESLSEIL